MGLLEGFPIGVRWDRGTSNYPLKFQSTQTVNYKKHHHLPNYVINKNMSCNLMLNCTTPLKPKKNIYDVCPAAAKCRGHAACDEGNLLRKHHQVVPIDLLIPVDERNPAPPAMFQTSQIDANSGITGLPDF